MNNTTNHINNTLFSEKNEARFVEAFERLVDHITAVPTSEEEEEWLKNYANATRKSSNVPLDQALQRVADLEKELAETNAKLSRRF
jgi:formiminotetrahydrofolate cyclodeaminase